MPDMDVKPESITLTQGPLTIPIAQMQVGFFWAAQRSVFPDGGPLSAEELEVRVGLAINALRTALVPGAEWWMSDRRRVS